jgi:hypothetical protein
MKNYSVVYLAEAEQELIAIWESATDRGPVADSANSADEILGGSPQNRSVYLGEELWKLDAAPLRFYFAIREADRIIEVSNVIRIAD